MNKPAVKTIPYHWVMTIQWAAKYVDDPLVTSVAFYTYGVIEAGPRDTRSKLFRKVFDSAVKQSASPRLRDPVPLFFSLEREELA